MTENTDKSQVMLIVLVVLAVVASIVMLFSSSAAAMKIAVLAALWAAFIGLFLVAKYRRLATEERERSEEKMKSLESQLRAEQAELASEKAIEASAQDTEMLREIRQQLSELRQHLEELSGRDFSYVPTTLTAEASRIRELETATEKAANEQKAEQEVEHPFAEAEIVPESGAKRFDTGSFAAVKLDAPTVEPEEVKEEEPVVTPAAEEPQEDGSHGRRRRDEKQDSISVAELLAQLKKKS
ncbi:IncA protein [Corynebacterium kalinowskii]|uniref:IncA protein n=1 Tax=Corynebacterium kalinowskii TaxID=2675216 RepID=A0A6B8VVD5_9CORY|nr:DUF6779 domain-containing protein [Corynebacterium kalinowskii]QGU01260.1 IncA protein [Corynebacterium kalinowskii]